VAPPRPKKKKLLGIPHLFHNPSCPAIPAAREPIFVAILVNLVGERRVTMKDVNVASVREVDKMLQRRFTTAVIVKDCIMKTELLMVLCRC
jgi:hypothetical protein